MTSDIETNIVSVERIKEYIDVIQVDNYNFCWFYIKY